MVRRVTSPWSLALCFPSCAMEKWHARLLWGESKLGAVPGDDPLWSLSPLLTLRIPAWEQMLALSQFSYRGLSFLKLAAEAKCLSSLGHLLWSKCQTEVRQASELGQKPSVSGGIDRAGHNLAKKKKNNCFLGRFENIQYCLQSRQTPIGGLPENSCSDSPHPREDSRTGMALWALSQGPSP